MANGGFMSGALGGLQAAQGVIGMMERPAQLEREKRKLALEEARNKLLERQVGVQEQQAERAGQTQEAMWNKSMMQKPTLAIGTLSRVGKKVKALSPMVNSILEDIDAGNIKTRNDLRGVLMNKSASGEFAEARVAMREEAARLFDQGKKSEAAGIMELYHATGKDNIEGFVDDIFGKPASMRRSAAERGANIKAPVTGGPKVWDERTQSWLQQMSDGSWKKVAQAGTKAAGRRIYDSQGNIVYEEGDLKTVPAGVAEKQASLITAIENLDEMESIIESGSISGKDMTGFWEFANKYADNWNLLGKQDLKRADLRQRVAMSLKFMYDVMGRQLAVQELKKGEAMLPDMNVDEAVFKNRVSNLRDYMVAMLVANKDTFQALGYKMQGLSLQGLKPGSKGVRGAIDDMGDELERRARDQGMPESQIDAWVEGELKRRFEGVF